MLIWQKTLIRDHTSTALQWKEYTVTVLLRDLWYDYVTILDTFTFYNLLSHNQILNLLRGECLNNPCTPCEPCSVMIMYHSLLSSNHIWTAWGQCLYNPCTACEHCTGMLMYYYSHYRSRECRDYTHNILTGDLRCAHLTKDSNMRSYQHSAAVKGLYNHCTLK